MGATRRAAGGRVERLEPCQALYPFLDSVPLARTDWCCLYALRGAASTHYALRTTHCALRSGALRQALCASFETHFSKDYTDLAPGARILDRESERAGFPIRGGDERVMAHIYIWPCDACTATGGSPRFRGM